MRLLRTIKPSALLIGLLGGIGLWSVVWNSTAAWAASLGIRWALGLSHIPFVVIDPWIEAQMFLASIQLGDVAAIAGLVLLCTTLVQLVIVLASLSITQTDSPLVGDPSSWVVIGQADDHPKNRPSGQN